MKIQIIGFAGSGKSTLAAKLSKKYNLPVLHLDSVYWEGDWQVKDFAKQQEEVKKFITENNDYVIEGNYFKLVPERFSSCDKLIFLNYNRFYCFKKAYQRYRQFKGTCRPDLPCKEKFDFAFAKWILFDQRTAKKRKQIKGAISACKGEVLTFKNQKELQKYLINQGILLG
ncbi:MAG: DNA topology modulation protein FlaR [Clostridiales bacterium]|nr:DNA topology modulation protein FlaR [Clostridiales bacterium]